MWRLAWVERRLPRSDGSDNKENEQSEVSGGNVSGENGGEEYRKDRGKSRKEPEDGTN